MDQLYHDFVERPGDAACGVHIWLGAEMTDEPKRAIWDCDICHPRG